VTEAAMKAFAGVLIAGLAIGAGPALACSSTDLTLKQRAFGDAVKAAFARDPGGGVARQAKAQAVIARYGDLKNSTKAGYIIDMLCKENDELLAIYK
jgi:hypothetical protein